MRFCAAAVVSLLFLLGCSPGGGSGGGSGGLHITTSSLPSATEGQSYSAYVYASGGTTPYTWSCSGLPAGLSWQQTGDSLHISGTPSSGTGGTHTIGLSVSDSSTPQETDSRNLSLSVGTSGGGVNVPYDPAAGDGMPLKWAIYVRICPDADTNFINSIADRIRTASQCFWNMSGGQCYIARAHISDNWGHAAEYSTYISWAQNDRVSVIIENLNSEFVQHPYGGQVYGYATGWGYTKVAVVTAGLGSVGNLVHEWGHAKFNLLDEYGGSQPACPVCIMGLQNWQWKWCISSNCTHPDGDCWDKMTAHFVNLVAKPDASHDQTVSGCPETEVETVNR